MSWCSRVYKSGVSVLGWVPGSSWRSDRSVSWIQLHLPGGDSLLVHHQVLQTVKEREENGTRIGQETISQWQWLERRNIWECLDWGMGTAKGPVAINIILYYIFHFQNVDSGPGLHQMEYQDYQDDEHVSGFLSRASSMCSVKIRHQLTVLRIFFGRQADKQWDLFMCKGSLPSKMILSSTKFYFC